MIAFDPASVEAQIEKLEKKAGEPDFWNDSDSAQATLKKLSALKASLTEVQDLESRSEELAELIELTELEGDTSLEGDIRAGLTELDEQVGEWVRRSMLGEETDANNAIVTVHSGAGGTESCD